MRHLFCCALLLLVWPFGAAYAHTASNSFIYLQAQQNQWEGRLDLAVADLPLDLSWTLSDDRELNWHAFQQEWPQLTLWLDQYVRWQGRQRDCVTVWQSPALTQHGDGLYVALPFQVNCFGGQLERLDYTLLLADNPLHRGLVSLRGQEGDIQYDVITERDTQLLLGTSHASAPRQVFSVFFMEGIWHLVTGYDHLAFLLALLLPAVLLRKAHTWQASPQLKPALKDSLVLVSAFTLAHSLTLVIATLGWITPPSALVEPLIGLTVILAGISLLYPIPVRWRFMATLIFGLVHGFGFAAMLGELIAASGQRIWGLVGFNLGIEVAQLAVVGVVLPLLFLIRNLIIYRRVLLPLASGVIGFLGLGWTVQALTG